jgi:hypothetical protein
MKKPLIETNPYLIDPFQRERLFYTSVCSSTAIEGVNVSFPLKNPPTQYPSETPIVSPTEAFYGPRR